MNSDSSASTSPMVLTPNSTGGSPDPSISSVAAKKSRRQTAFYPNVNSSNKPQKPFSRSAAKRESVMALGSIEHLQHYFTKTGIAAKRNPFDKPHRGLVPAIGGPTHVRTSPSISTQFHLPPSPEVPAPPRPTFPPYIKTYETDPESLLPGVVDDLAAVSRAWCLDSYPSRNNADLLTADGNPGTNRPPPFDVLGVLKTTTRVIRSVRNYLLSLPDESAGTIRSQFRPKILGPGKPHQNATPPSSTQPDPLTLIRRSALEVLTVLRALEESYRLPLSDDAYDAQSEGGNSRGGGSHSRMASPSNKPEELPADEDLAEPELSEGQHDPDASVTFSLVQVQGRHESVPVWEDEEDGSFRVGATEEEKEKKEHWDERLVLGSGWLYRQDVTLEELEEERRVVGAYVDAVDEVLFDGKKTSGSTERGWERERRRVAEKEGREVSRAKGRRVSAIYGGTRGLGMVLSTGDGGKRRVSTGMLDMMDNVALSEEPEDMGDINEVDEAAETIDDEELPEWAQRRSYVDDDLGRAHAILSSFLPSHRLPALASPSSRIPFLASLSSGQLLCIAYNACVRKSKHPWGYVTKDGIHDILALEKAEREDAADSKVEGGKKGWTFRRTDNLRLWAGALKLRYMLPIQVPSQLLTQSSGPGAPARPITPMGSPGPAQRFLSTTTEPPIMFDARVVARQDDGWADMLEDVLLRWIRKVVDERRGVR